MSEKSQENTKRASPPRKPLLFAENPLADMRVKGMDARPDHLDPSYIPGYSDVRWQNDLRRAKGQKTLPQNARAQWVRVSRRDGTTVRETDEGMMEWLRLGYRAAGLDDLKKLGWEMPPTAEVGADGLIRRGDLALFYVDAEQADENRRDQIGRNVEARDRESELESKQGLEVLPTEQDKEDHKGSLAELSKLELPNLDK